MKQSHFHLILQDDGHDIFAPRKSQSWGYRYGPSIMVHDGIAEAWFATTGDSFEADWFTYRRSTDGGQTWSEEQVVMTPVPDSMDWFSVCDPAVIKYGEYYYIGYTSTIFANGGGVCNNAFIGRSKSPTGPFERWNGHGWGEQRVKGDTTLSWMGKPAPVIYYDEDWHNWGAGEFSFVIKDETIYLYYTWTSKDADGNPIHETRVATADITNENWPGAIVQQGVAVTRPKTGNDSYDVVYCEDLHKFVALSTDKRFTEDSFLAVYESDDGLRYTRVNEIKNHVGWMCHNCGISGDEQHHIRSGDTMMLAYAYGNKWGFWGTRLHAYRFEAMEEPFYSEQSMQSNHIPVVPFDDPETYEPTSLFLSKPHFMRVPVGKTMPLQVVTGNVIFDFRPAGDQVVFSNYDTDLISIENGQVTAKAVGYTYVTATLGKLSCEFLVYVTESEPAPFEKYRPFPEKKVVAFKPILTEYHASLAKHELKQIRGIADYEDGSWFELAGNVDLVTYVNHNPELITVQEDGNVRLLGKTGTALVTVQCGGFAFDVHFTVDL